jgi:hypothetical protein
MDVADEAKRLERAFHDSHSFLIAAFSAALFSAKEGSPRE